MCSLVIDYRPDAPWPVILAANRDEMLDRPWDPPGRHWPDRPNVVAGRDRLAGGSWLGLNDEGVVAGILNRVDSLGPKPGFRSRGELVLEALDHADAAAAAGALGGLDARAYRSFNLVIADNRDAFWLRNRGAEADAERIETIKLPPGLSMFTAHDRNDLESTRIQAYLPRFRAAPRPDPAAGDAWAAWEALLASREGAGPFDAMAVVTDSGFGTVSSALIALPAIGAGVKPVWRFAAGLPGAAAFVAVAI
jgi:hypothetical protein